MVEHVTTEVEIDGRRHRSLHVLMWHLGKWDAPIYAALVAVGIPLMSIFVQDLGAKVVVGFGFLSLTPFYWWIELGELKSQIAMRGLLDPREIDSQRKSMQLLYWGVALAFVIWCFGLVGGWRHPSYGIIEWFLLVHTLAVGWSTMSIIYPLMDEYLQATSAQRRFETAAH